MADPLGYHRPKTPNPELSTLHVGAGASQVAAVACQHRFGWETIAVTISIRSLLCPCSVAYCTAYGLTTSGWEQEILKWLPTLVEEGDVNVIYTGKVWRERESERESEKDRQSQRQR